MNRREFLAGCGGGLALASSGISLARGQAWRAPPDYALRIAPISLELSPKVSVRTLAYNGTVPGPLLRVREGTPVSIDVSNDTDLPEFVHWHGLELPSSVDGAPEEGTPPVDPHTTRRYSFTPRPAGTRWYHSHIMAGRDLHRSTFSGQFGFLMVEGPTNPARHDQEIFLALHDWNPYIVGGDDGFPTVGYTHASINGRLLGEGDPIRVREGERVLVHFLNASADVSHNLALPGHRFTVVALDGNAVPTPRAVDQLRIDPSERIDAIIEMTAPGVWILGETRDPIRRAGMGVVVEYAGRTEAPAWKAATGPVWNSFDFAAPIAPDAIAAEPIPLVFTSQFKGHGAFEGWRINGVSAPAMEKVLLSEGHRYRLLLDNQSTEDHPVHLHRHTFELLHADSLRRSGIRKDTLLVAAGTHAAVEFVANNPGPTLLHCHLQDHMDAGFMMMFDYR